MRQEVIGARVWRVLRRGLCMRALCLGDHGLQLPVLNVLLVLLLVQRSGRILRRLLLLGGGGGKERHGGGETVEWAV